jgi:hypothetical protein
VMGGISGRTCGYRGLLWRYGGKGYEVNLGFFIVLAVIIDFLY